MYSGREASVRMIKSRFTINTEPSPDLSAVAAAGSLKSRVSVWRNTTAVSRRLSLHSKSNHPPVIDISYSQEHQVLHHRQKVGGVSTRCAFRVDVKLFGSIICHEADTSTSPLHITANLSAWAVNTQARRSCERRPLRTFVGPSS